MDLDEISALHTCAMGVLESTTNRKGRCSVDEVPAW
jgi:hypothetical protein